MPGFARLTEALALGSGGKPPTAIVTSISGKEREIEAIHEKFLSTSPDSIEARMVDIRRFVTSRLTDIRRLLGAEIQIAKAEPRKHIDFIELNPMERNGGKILVALSEWNL
jgi:hypothetical protein